jgi:UDP-4-amino-4-deoxy-L-arabinose-oxoglutarate aminotransferase
MQVAFYRHDLKPADAEKIAKVLATPILTSGAVGKAVEAQLAQFFSTKYAGLCNSWTNGALAALLAMDIGPGDEVIVPAMTFISSANIVELVGAKPVFVDVERDTLLVSLDAVKAALTPATKAVIPVHLYGQMVDLRRLRAMLAGVNRADVRIIEDSAHCFEGRLEDYGPGRHSDIALFSFYATKNVACGEGGAYVTDSEDLYLKMAQTRLHGMSAGAVDRYQKGSYRHWDMERLGTKANLPDLLAALLPDQIATIRERLPVRRRLAARYEEAFRDTGIRIARVRESADSARHIFPIHVKPALRDEAIAALNAAGIGVAVNFRSVPTAIYYRKKYGYGPGDFPVSYDWGEGEITLPLFPSMTREEQDHVIATVREEIAPRFGHRNS